MRQRLAYVKPETQTDVQSRYVIDLMVCLNEVYNHPLFGTLLVYPNFMLFSPLNASDSEVMELFESLLILIS